MRTVLLVLALSFVGCAMSYVPPEDGGRDAGALPGDDAATPEPDAGAPVNVLCAAALAQSDEMQCAVTPGAGGVHACPVQWDGSESCDPARVQGCLDALARAETCLELQTAWRASCLTGACTPTPP